MMKIYGIRNCSTMKKAFAWLDSQKIAYDFHDYKKDGVPPEKLSAWAKRVGWEALANTRGPTWRTLPESSKANLNETRALALLAKNASAIRRPIVEDGSRLLIGFDAAEFEKALKR